MMLRKSLVALALCVAGCAMFSGQKGGIQLSGVERDKLLRQYEGREFVLASSVYVSDFFGSTDRMFADARPFDIITLYRHDGEQASMGLAKSDIIPAGTPVRVRKLEFPLEGIGTLTDARKDLALAPTAHTWIEIERTDAPGSLPLVLVLAKDITGPEAFEAEVQKRLASPQWMTGWLAQSDPTHLALIFQKQVTAGMSRAAMYAALGEPRNAAAEAEQGTLEYVADYGDLQITVQGNIVAKVVSQKAEAEMARQEANTKAEQARLAAEAKRAEDQKLAAARAELDKQKAAEAEQARLVREAGDAKLRAETEKKEAAQREADAKKLAVEQKKQAAADAEAKKQAELKARLDAAKLAKALAAQTKSDAEAKRAEADAEAARQKVAAAQAEVAVALKKLEATKAESKPVATTQPVATQAAPPPPPRKVGVKLAALEKAQAFDLGVTSLDGALLVGVTPGGAADKAGLLANDLVLDVDGQAVKVPEDFTRLVGATAYDKTLKVTVWRGKQKVALKIAAQELPSAVALRPMPVPAAAVTTTTKPVATSTASAEPAPAPAQSNKSLMPSRRSSEAGTAE